jgi:hypothetical protein
MTGLPGGSPIGPPGRRVALLLPLWLAACGDDDEPPRVARREFPPLRYAYLPPINLNVQRVESAEGFIPPAGHGEVSDGSPVNLADTLFAMARDRLKPMGTTGVATFSIQTASIARHRDTLNGALAVRLDIRNGDGGNTGYAEAHVTAERAGSIADQRAAIYDMFKSLMDEMNVELEFQIRSRLRSWIVEPMAAPSPEAPPPVPPIPPATPPPVPPAVPSGSSAAPSGPAAVPDVVSPPMVPAAPDLPAPAPPHG